MPDRRMMSMPPLPRARPAAALALAAFALLVFAALAADLRWHGPVTRLDPGSSIWLHGRTHPLLTQFMVAVSHISSTAGVCAMAALAAAWLAWRRAFHWLLLLVAVVPGGLILNASLKVFARARPLIDGLPVSDISSSSFPSGHTAGATVWWGFALLLWFAIEHRSGPRFAGAALAATLVLLTAFSRVYLGFHYPADVLAAIAEGLAWLFLCTLLVPRLQGSPFVTSRLA